MAYKDFTLDTLQQTFGLSAALPVPLFADVPPCEPPAWLAGSLHRGTSLALVSEKARSEFIVAPVLLACRELLQDACAIYSGVRLDADSERGLAGECDFLLARTPPTPNLMAPVAVLLEAKKNDIDDGLGQCAAQMLGAQLFNNQRNQVLPCMYGCVTTGEVWQFLRLQASNLHIDSRRYFLNEINNILGILISMFGSPVPVQQASDAA